MRTILLLATVVATGGAGAHAPKDDDARPPWAGTGHRR